MTADFSRAAWDDSVIAVPPAVVDRNAALNACLKSLTSYQLEAVTNPPEPLLVLAGAGTGKTKCLVSRIAHKIATGQRLPSQILAVTFTRKAAAEMKRRLAAMIGPAAIAMDIGTFHAVCAKMLRSNPTIAQTPENFSTVDDTDQKRIVREIMTARAIKAEENACRELAACENLNFHTLTAEEQAAVVASLVKSRAKNKTSLPRPKFDTKEILSNIESYKTELCLAGSPWNMTRSAPDVYEEYQKALNDSSALDYTDIIIHAVNLLRETPEVARYYQTVWASVLVDEYQDTSPIQELWIDLLSPPDASRDLTCVGDDDQLIYTWRGADQQNILQFAKKRTTATIVRLEENFRSVSDILDHANAIISHNRERHGKTLFTSAIQSNAVETFEGDKAFRNEFEECDWIIEKIKKELAKGVPPREIAVITRTGQPLMLVQSRLTIARIPFTLTAGTKYNETKDVRAIVAYLRAARNHNDDLALRVAIETRNIAKPSGFGQTSIDNLFNSAQAIGKSARFLLDQQLSQGKIPPKKAAGLIELVEVLDNINEDFVFKMPLKDAAARAIEDIGLAKTIAKHRADAAAAIDKYDQEALTKKANNLESRIQTFIDAAEESDDIAEFIDTMALSNVENDLDPDAVWLGTIHGAKGLEFERVFLPAWEPGIFPMRDDSRCSSSEREEERRLAYVAITRAKRRVTISHTLTPRAYVKNTDNKNRTNRSPYFDLIKHAFQQS